MRAKLLAQRIIKWNIRLLCIGIRDANISRTTKSKLVRNYNTYSEAGYGSVLVLHVRPILRLRHQLVEFHRSIFLEWSATLPFCSVKTHNRKYWLTNEWTHGVWLSRRLAGYLTKFAPISFHFFQRERLLRTKLYSQVHQRRSQDFDRGQRCWNLNHLIASKKFRHYFVI